MVTQNLQPFSHSVLHPPPLRLRILDGITGPQGATTALTFEYSDFKLLPPACLTEAEGFALVAVALT